MCPVSAVEHLDSGNEPMPVVGELGLLFKTPSGNQGPYAGQNKAVNGTISQTVAVGANRTFTFTGHSRIQADSAAIVNTLGELYHWATTLILSSMPPTTRSGVTHLDRPQIFARTARTKARAWT